MPIRRRIQLAVPLVNRISGVEQHAKTAPAGPAAARAVATGRATARFLGTNSPNTIDTEVAISRPTTNATPS